MRMRPAVLLVLLVLGFIAVGLSQTQQEPASEGRRVLRKATPIYPEIAKRMNLSGAVKVQVTVAPDGSVKTIQPVGGSPVLIQAAEDAIYKWKFATGPAETKEVIEIRFAPQ